MRSLIDPSVLATLPRREFRAGLYEVVKYGMTSSASLFDRLRRECDAIFAQRTAVLMAIIAESCRIKADVVSADEQESGLRRILNFGHTAGHALEAVTRYRRYRHGEAVAYGMLVAAELGAARGALARPGSGRARRSHRQPGTAAADCRCRRLGDARFDEARQEGGRRAPALRAADRGRGDDDRRRCHRR